ncbi:MAG: bifunctional DedA family/phosphatase PAP2 family protein [Gemmatimonadaceae bacterium]|nr:bifunctional DedA family/phosphatase PAP2 family protein [Gemmatimonadaceae bacterium]
MISSAVLAWVSRYGYLAVALGVFLESAGLPVPGETAVLAAAFAAAHGGLSLPLVALVAFTAGVLGDNLGYWVGRRYGREWVQRHGRWILLTPSRLDRMDAFFRRFGPAAVAIARFVAGVRVVAAFAAGVSRMPWLTFLRWNVLGALGWAVVTTGIGYALGRGYTRVAALAGRASVGLLFIVPVALAVVWLVRYSRRHPGVIGGRAPLADGSVRAWGERLGWRAATALALSIGTTLAFARTAEDVAERETAPLDSAVRIWAAARHSPVLDLLFTAFTWAGSTFVLGPVSLIAAWVLWRRHGRRIAAISLMAPVIASVTMLALKAAFHRQRPDGALRYAHMGYSFPSGHTTVSTAVAVTLAYLLVREQLAPRWVVLAVGATFPILVGLSRIYLDVHWATDVIGGWTIGLGIAMAAAVLYEWLRVADDDDPVATAPATM